MSGRRASRWRHQDVMPLRRDRAAIANPSCLVRCSSRPRHTAMRKVGWVSTPVATSDVAHRRLAARNLTSLACARNGLTRGLRGQLRLQPPEAVGPPCVERGRGFVKLTDSAPVPIDYASSFLALLPFWKPVGFEGQRGRTAKTRIDVRISGTVRDTYIRRSSPQRQAAASPR